MADTTRDPAVYLAEIREDLRSGYSEAAADRIREQHIPALLAAVEAALGFHEPVRSNGRTVCGACTDSYGEHEDAPCDEYRAISRELPGEVSGA